MAFITLVRLVSTLTIILISMLYTSVCPVPKLLAYADNTSIDNNQMDGPNLTIQAKLHFIYQSVPSPQALVPSSNLTQAKNLNGSQNSSTNSAESVMGSYLNPKILLGSAVNQIRNGTSSGINKFGIGGSGLSFFGNYKMILLARQIIPPKNFILLFEAQPSEVSIGQIAAKLPCDPNYASPLKLFVVETNLGLKIHTRLIDLNVISELSKPGFTCVYKAKILNTPSISMNSMISHSPKNNTNSIGSEMDREQPINSVGLLNPTSYQQVLPPTSSITLGFNEANSTAPPLK